ncbi:MAG: GAF domain-containing protein, partial [Chloroflexi bacterium]|nr:GAF domain-containing protein [Chloroflexota bacterium]
MGTAAEIAALVLALSLLCYALVLLRKARRQQGLAARAEQLQVINEIGQDIAATLDVSSIMDHVVRILRDRLGHYDANILLLDPQGTELTWQAGTRIDPALAPAGSLRCSLGTGIIGQAAKLGQPLYASDVLQDPDYVAVPQLPDTRSELAVPIQIGDRLLGVLDVQSTQLDAYTQD